MLSVRDVNRGLGCLVDEVLCEEVEEAPVEVFVHVAEAMTLGGEHEHVKAFVGVDEGMNNTLGITRVNVVVDVAVNEHETTFEILGDFGVCLDRVDKCSVTFFRYFFFHTVVGLAPPAVIDVVIVVTGTRNGRFEEVGINEHCSC